VIEMICLRKGFQKSHCVFQTICC